MYFLLTFYHFLSTYTFLLYSNEGTKLSFFSKVQVSFVRYFDLRYPVPTLVPYSLHKVGKLNLSNDWNLKIVKTCFEAKSKNFFKMRNHVDFNEPNIGSNTKTHIFYNSELNSFM